MIEFLILFSIVVDFCGLANIRKSKNVNEEIIDKLRAIVQAQAEQQQPEPEPEGEGELGDNSLFGDEDIIKADNTVVDKWKE